jgi:H+/Cl- antiporter ClcA
VPEVKKYIVALLPLAICMILAVLYANMEPKDYPDPRYPWSTQASLDYFTSMWVIIGIGITGALVGMLLIGDVFSKVERYRERRRLRKLLER